MSGVCASVCGLLIWLAQPQAQLGTCGPSLWSPELAAGIAVMSIIG